MAEKNYWKFELKNWNNVSFIKQKERERECTSWGLVIHERGSDSILLTLNKIFWQVKTDKILK